MGGRVTRWYRSIWVSFIGIVSLVSLPWIFFVNFHIQDQESHAKGTDQSRNIDTVDVLYGLKGTSASLYDAWEVSLKSVLLNAPLDLNIRIHILCSEDAYINVLGRIKKAGLAGTLWRNEITLVIHNVGSHETLWQQFLTEKMGNFTSHRITLGGYYRLLAYKILGPLNIGPTIYMDTDVVVLANLNDLVKNFDNSKVFQGSAKSFCSGFVVINMRIFHKFWDIVNANKPKKLITSDQDIMEEVRQSFPELYGQLPSEWDRNLGNGYRAEPQKILAEDTGAGMLHYQGGSSRSVDKNYYEDGFQYICDRRPNCRSSEESREMVSKSWGLGDFYTRITWKWVFHLGRSKISFGKKGFELNIADKPGARAPVVS